MVLRHEWILQQDGVPLHIARNSVAYMQRENVVCIEPDMCPNNPHLNGGELRHLRPYRSESTIDTIDQLKQAIVLE